MTVQEFINKNNDILCEEIAPDELLTLEQGTALFCISTYTGTASKYNRKVATAGYCLVTFAYKDSKGTVSRWSEPEFMGINTLRLTTSGYAQIDAIRPADITDTGNKVLFRCKTIGVDDPRFNLMWDNWPV